MMQRKEPTATRDLTRTCVGCRRSGDPATWWRVSAGAAGLDVGSTAPGRGAWVCSPACFERAIRKGALGRALRRDLSNHEVDDVRARLFG